MKKTDFSKELKELYTARRKVEEVTAERGLFLAVDDTGAPGGEAFVRAVEQLYGLAYTAKFELKLSGVLDFAVSKLECVYLVNDPIHMPMDEWDWRVLIRIPEEVTQAHLNSARKTLMARKGVDTSSVKRVTWREGRAVQMLHVGPYENLGETYKTLCEAAAGLGYRVKGPGHEIYLSDPRRSAPEKLRTIVRLPISHPRPAYARKKES